VVTTIPNKRNSVVEDLGRTTTTPEDFADVQSTLFATVVDPEGKDDELRRRCIEGLPATARRGIMVYNQAYFLRILDTLKSSLPVLTYIVGGRGMSQLTQAFLAASGSRRYSLDLIGEPFAAFLKTHGEAAVKNLDTDLPARLALDLVQIDLKKAAAFRSEDDHVVASNVFHEIKDDEWEHLSLQFGSHVSTTELAYDVLPLMASQLSKDEDPAVPSATPRTMLAYRKHQAAEARYFGANEDYWWRGFAAAKSFGQLVEESSDSEDTAINEGLIFLKKWIDDGLVSAIFTNP
jgi:hypothetical protein